MRFLTASECREWCTGRGFTFAKRDRPTAWQQGELSVMTPVPNLHERLASFSGAIVDRLGDFDECLMWVTEWGIWPSSENLHLYYRLRQSYLDVRLLHEAPGHLFLGYERPDPATLIEVSILFGWGFHLLPHPTYLTAFVSHDEFIDWYTDNSGVQAEIEKDWK